jgi:hypothetical protein
VSAKSPTRSSKRSSRLTLQTTNLMDFYATTVLVKVGSLNSQTFTNHRYADDVRDSGGRATGSATVEGRRTVFRDASGRTVWMATTSGSQTTTFRDAAGRTQRRSSESGGRTTFRDASGRTTSTVQPTGSSTTFKDAAGRTMGTSIATGMSLAPASPTLTAVRHATRRPEHPN